MKKTFFLATALACMLSACESKLVEQVQLIPQAESVEILNGAYALSNLQSIQAPEAWKATAENFINDVKKTANMQVSLATEGASVVLAENANLPKEAYTLSITKNGIQLEANSVEGISHALTSLHQLILTAKDGQLPVLNIQDKPLYGYRGLMLDCSRHFWTVDELKESIDQMDFFKFNTLHLHLTDNQAWRMAVDKYPSLIKEGTYYYDFPEMSGKYYSKEDLKEIVRYAGSRGIEVIPEIDLPGHMLAALASYPELGCSGGPYEVWGKWGVADEVLCAGREETMIFLEDVLDEVADLFPSEYFHIGGDECPKVCWEKCPRCQAKIKELGLKDEGEFKAEHYLQSYVMTRMSNFLEKKGKKIIGWDEILEGEVAENAIVMSWRGTEGGIKAAQMGHDVVMTPNSFFYLDYYQSEDKDNEPLAIGGYLPVEKCYSYEPCTDEMTPEQQKHILGVQANLWTEYIGTNEYLEYMLLPRMTALSEVQWCQPENKNWERFLDSADEFCAIYDMAGYNYGKHIFNVRGSVSAENGNILVTLQAQGETPVRYTLDGSEPCEESALYEGPVAISETCVLKAKAMMPNTDTRVYQKEFKTHKAMAKNITLNTEAHRNYNAGLPYILADGIRGTENFRSGDWAGWRTEPFDITIDMEGETYSNVTVSTVVIKYDDIFNLAALTILTSYNGTDFTEVAKAEYEVEGKGDPNGLKQCGISFPETSAKYIRIVADPVKELPSWHERAGSNGFLFIDEVIVE